VFNLHLWPDTRYVVGILGARSTTGQSLDKPAVFTFTTGGALPKATVSGNVTYPGGDPTGTMIALFRNLFTDDNPEALAVVSSAAGSYTVKYVPAGTYWPVALKDLDKSGDFEPKPGADVVGIYDPDGNGFIDSLVVPEGGIVSGVNMSLAPLTNMTARQRYSEAQMVAQNWSSDAHAVLVGAPEILVSGESGFWVYVFYSRVRSGYLGILASSAFLAPFAWQDEPPDTTGLPNNWIDSNVAADSAEAHGGSNFRMIHADAAATAFLGNFDFGDQALAAHTHTPPVPKFGLLRQPHRLAKDLAFSFQKATRPQSARPLWVFQYRSEATGDFLMVFLDAITGEFIEPPGPRPTTARVNLEAANQAAQTWALDAVLVMLGTHQSNLSPTGEAMMWFFVYYSASLDSVQVFFFSNGIILGQGPLSWEPPSKSALPSNWIDSGPAISVAEVRGGSQYRATNQNVWVNGSVSRGILPGQPERAVWGFDYTSSTAGQLTIYVDAVTGTGVEARPQSNEIPQNYALRQNHPNPLQVSAFGNKTAIEYHLPRPSAVEISIFNLQGQKVVTLVQGHQTAGSHKIFWNGADESGRPVAGGVYFYQLKAADFVAVKKMLVVH
ncbi:MAG: T9SS type A sorting domain-containing protein, partial [candidate division KSB1 bacterium]|nr:T9SS type A sorting domain-containing protein [candidate division KSB1 bacterium]